IAGRGLAHERRPLPRRRARRGVGEGLRREHAPLGAGPLGGPPRGRARRGARRRPAFGGAAGRRGRPLRAPALLLRRAHRDRLPAARRRPPGRPRRLRAFLITKSTAAGNGYDDPVPPPPAVDTIAPGTRWVPPSFGEVYDEHFDFVFRTVRRLGVPL